MVIDKCIECRDHADVEAVILELTAAVPLSSGTTTDLNVTTNNNKPMRPGIIYICMYIYNCEGCLYMQCACV